MGLNEKYRSGFIEQIKASRRGDTTFIPNFLDRVNEVFNLMQSRYTLIFGSTGVGKTAIADYLFILAPWTYLRTNEPDIHWEVVYFSLERKSMFKHAKWLSWFMYRDYSHLISSDELMGWGSDPLNKEGYDLVRGYDDEMSELLEHVHIYDGKTTVNRVRHIINKRALELGTLYTADDDEVRIANTNELVATFSNEFVEKTKVGNIKYVDLIHKDKKFRIYQSENRYFLTNPKTFVFIIIDGIGLMGSSDFGKKKSALDETSSILAEARDLYGFSPVVISQQNRDLGSTARLKMHGSDMSPQLEDIQGSSQMAHDSDLTLALFDPFHYKAYDTKGHFGGYDLLKGMMHPKGFSRFRSLHVIKNTFGFAGKMFGLKFLGESNDFSVLPFPNSEEILKIYSEIAEGR